MEGKKGKLQLDSTSVAEYTGNNDNEMEVITMNDFFEEYSFTPDILKMDCEGCEFEIIEKKMIYPCLMKYFLNITEKL